MGGEVGAKVDGKVGGKVGCKVSGRGGGDGRRILFNHVNWQRFYFSLLSPPNLIAPKMMESRFPRTPHWSCVLFFSSFATPECFWLVVVSKI